MNLVISHKDFARAVSRIRLYGLVHKRNGVVMTIFYNKTVTIIKPRLGKQTVVQMTRFNFRIFITRANTHLMDAVHHLRDIELGFNSIAIGDCLRKDSGIATHIRNSIVSDFNRITRIKRVNSNNAIQNNIHVMFVSNIGKVGTGVGRSI